MYLLLRKYLVGPKPGDEFMSGIIAIIPWDLVGTWLATHAVEYYCGKTDRFEAKSAFELVQNIFCRMFDKSRKI